jgi:hypothetical protein
LPEPLSSFGAVVSDGYLYVYGGHIGKAHAHSRDNLSRRFARIALGERAAWEDLPFQTPVQGLALVARQEMLYRIGGMTATNAAGEPDVSGHPQMSYRTDGARRHCRDALSRPGNSRVE